MAYKLRYQLYFKSRENTDWRIDIEVEGYKGAEVTQLLGASNPFEWMGKGGDDQTECILGSTGYLRIVVEDEKAMQGLTPTTYQSHRVSAFHRMDEKSPFVLAWFGYLSPESYDQDYISAPYEVEIPIKSPLAIAGDVSVDMSVMASETMTLGNITRALLDKLWNGLQFKSNWQTYINYNNATSGRMWYDLRWSRWMIFKDADEKITVKDILKKIFYPYGHLREYSGGITISFDHMPQDSGIGYFEDMVRNAGKIKQSHTEAIGEVKFNANNDNERFELLSKDDIRLGRITTQNSYRDDEKMINFYGADSALFTSKSNFDFATLSQLNRKVLLGVKTEADLNKYGGSIREESGLTFAAIPYNSRIWDEWVGLTSKYPIYGGFVADKNVASYIKLSASLQEDEIIYVELYDNTLGKYVAVDGSLHDTPRSNVLNKDTDWIAWKSWFTATPDDTHHISFHFDVRYDDDTDDHCVFFNPTVSIIDSRSDYMYYFTDDYQNPHREKNITGTGTGKIDINLKTYGGLFPVQGYPSHSIPFGGFCDGTTGNYRYTPFVITKSRKIYDVDACIPIGDPLHLIRSFQHINIDGVQCFTAAVGMNARDLTTRIKLIEV